MKCLLAETERADDGHEQRNGFVGDCGRERDDQIEASAESNHRHHFTQVLFTSNCHFTFCDTRFVSVQPLIGSNTFSSWKFFADQRCSGGSTVEIERQLVSHWGEWKGTQKVSEVFGTHNFIWEERTSQKGFVSTRATKFVSVDVGNSDVVHVLPVLCV